MNRGGTSRAGFRNTSLTAHTHLTRTVWQNKNSSHYTHTLLFGLYHFMCDGQKVPANMGTILPCDKISNNLCFKCTHFQTAQVKALNMFHILFVFQPPKTNPVPSLWNLPNIIIFCLAALKRNHSEIYTPVFFLAMDDSFQLSIMPNASEV